MLETEVCRASSMMRWMDEVVGRNEERWKKSWSLADQSKWRSEHEVKSQGPAVSAAKMETGTPYSVLITYDLNETSTNGEKSLYDTCKHDRHGQTADERQCDLDRATYI